MKRRLCAVFLAVTLILALIPTTAFAANTDSTDYVTTIAEAGAQLREGMTKRQKNIVVRFSTSGKKTNPAATVYQEAIKHTGVPDEGDYLRYQCGGWSADIGHTVNGNKVYYTIYYNMRYYTTASQEKALDTQVDKIVNSLSLQNADDYKKVQAIYDYICTHVAYDYAHTSSSYMLKYSCYGAAVNRAAVCQGYALMFYRLALECGLDSRVIIGTGNGNSHSWDIVKVNGKYYHVDPTWDAGRGTYAYFLKGNTYPDHYRNSEYSSTAFCNAYPVSSSSYDPSKYLSAPTITGLSNTATGITVKWNKVSYATGYQIYRRTGSGDWSLVKTVSSGSTTSWTNTGRTNGTKYQYKIRATSSSAKSAFSSVKTKYFVAPPTVTLSNATNSITVKWNKVAGATGYKIYRKTGSGNWSMIKTISDGSVVSWTNTNRVNGTKYQYKVVAVKTVSGTDYQSAYSAAKTIYHLTRPTVSSAANSGAGKLTVKWDKNSKATGYQVKYVTGSTTKTVKVTSNATLSKSLTNLAKDSTYKVYVRSYKTVGSSTYYSAYSAYKSVKIDK